MNGTSAATSTSTPTSTSTEGPGRIEDLTRANRDERTAERERDLVRLRHRAFSELDTAPPTGPWPPITPTRDDGGPPELSPTQLTTGSLRDGIFGHGSVLVRGLIGTERARHLADGIEQTFTAYDTRGTPGPRRTSSYFQPFNPSEHKIFRPWVRQGGGVLASDSPPMLFDLLETLEAVGLRSLIADHLGERPVLSARKCTLRKVSPDSNNGWHQDGAFMGPDIRALNVWITLSPCGEDAPGLDIVPRRLDELVETGTGGSYFDWAVGPETVEGLTGGQVWSPRFEAGDVMLFDEMCLHRTGVTPAMTRHRYAIETWFFAASAYPDGQIPLVW